MEAPKYMAPALLAKGAREAKELPHSSRLPGAPRSATLTMAGQSRDDALDMAAGAGRGQIQPGGRQQPRR